MKLKRNLKRSAKQIINYFGYDVVPLEYPHGQSQKSFQLDPAIPEPFASILGGEALYQLIHFHDFETVLDVGSGAGVHARIMRDYGKSVTELDFGKSIYYEKRENTGDMIVYGDFMSYVSDQRYDCIWASHVLEHQPNPGLFIKRCIELVSDEGIIAISVPPLKHKIVGGHLSLWNAGLLLYQLVFAGLDCRNASVRTSGYNVSVITRKVLRPKIELDYDSGDIDRLASYFPSNFNEGFDGRIAQLNWFKA